MTPLPVKPTVVVKIQNGNVVSVANNISPELKIMVVDMDSDFEYESANKPFVDKDGTNVLGVWNSDSK